MREPLNLDPPHFRRVALAVVVARFLEDFAHAASPEQRLNFVVPEPRTFFEPDGQRWGLTVTPEWRSVSTRAHLMGSSTFRSTLLD
jgi:hypothetical protein